MTSSWQPNWVAVVAGMVIAGGALLVSVSSYESASRGGGSYVVLWGAVFVGAAMALRGLTRTRGTIEGDARQRAGEERVAFLELAMGTTEWHAAKRRHQSGADHLLSDAEIAERVVAENHARADEGAARWRANAAAAHAATLGELRRSMTPEEWEAKRVETTESFRWSRQNAARYWMENTASRLPSALRTLPDHLDPASVPVAEDWQVAMYLRPIKLDNEGKPAASAAKDAKRGETNVAP